MYFNFTSHIANDWWDRRAFLATWWRANARDRRWTPPAHTFLGKVLLWRRSAFINALYPDLITLEAVTSKAFSTNIGGMVMPAGMGDAIVAQAFALHDRHTQPATVYLTLMAIANDEETLDRLLQSAWQNGAAHAVQRLIAPAQLAPSFSPGLLMDHFHLSPPLHTPYNAPFVPELLQGAMEPLCESVLWHLDVAHAPVLQPLPPDTQIVHFDVNRLAADLLPLAQAAAVTAGVLDPPTADEVAFALGMWSADAGGAPLAGRLATVGDKPVAFYLAQADTGGQLRRWRGGRPLWARAFLALRPRTRAAVGRLLLGTPVPHAHQHGVAVAMLDDARAFAQAMGWRTLTIGPLPVDDSTALVMADAGATPHQRYTLFEQVD